MEIQHQQNEDEGLFYMTKGDQHVAEMFYTLTSANRMSIYHTEVNEAMQGHHLGEKLVEAGVDFARKNHFKIEPACSFAKSIFDKGNFDDVLA